MLVRKPKLKSSNEKAPIVCSSDGEPKSNKNFFNICSNEQTNTTCTRNTWDKNCQADKSAHMQPVKPAMDMWSNGSAVLLQYKMSKQQILPQEDDKNCQVNNKAVCADKKCQVTKCYKKVDKNCQTTNMWPVKPEMDMQLP